MLFVEFLQKTLKHQNISYFFTSFLFCSWTWNPPISDITWCSIWTHVSTCTNELIRMFFVDSCDSMALTLQGQGCNTKYSEGLIGLTDKYCIWSICSAFRSSHGEKCFLQFPLCGLRFLPFLRPSTEKKACID